MSRYVIADAGNIYKSIFSEAEVDVIGFPYSGFKEGKNYNWFFYRFTHSKKLGYPLFNVWNKYVINRWHVKKGDTVLILSNAVWSDLWNVGIIDQLKRKGCKIALLLIDSLYLFENDRLTRINEAIASAPLIYTFDKADAENNRFRYTHSYYSKIDHITPIGKKCDVFCAIWNGDRLHKLIEIYDVLEHKGIKCEFYIHGVSDEDQKKFQRRHIIYNHFLPYEEIIGRSLSANVILELVKTKQRGSTLREYEAVVYGKRLLTDCDFIKDIPCYNENYMKSFSCAKDIEKIDLSFFKDSDSVDYDYHGEFSPRILFKEIEELLK